MSKRQMRRLLAVGVAAVLAAIWVGATAAQSREKQTAAQKKVLIGVSLYTIDSTIFGAIYRGFKDEARAEHADVTFTNANTDLQKQANQIQDLLTKHIDGLIVHTSNPNSLKGPMDQAIAAKIPLVNAWSGLSPDFNKECTVPGATWVGYPEVQWTKATIERLITKIPNDGVIAWTDDTIDNNSVFDLRKTAIEAEAKKHPNITFVAVQSHNTPDDTLTAWENFAAKQPKVDAVFNMGGQVDKVYQALSDAGYKNVVYGSLGGLDNDRALIKQGVPLFTAWSSLYGGARVMMRTAIAEARGKKTSDCVTLPWLFLDKSNLAKYAHSY